MTWLPIDSAYKDGTPFIAYRPSADNKTIKRVGEEFWLQKPKYMPEGWGRSTVLHQPTMWQPYPLEPKISISASIKEQSEISNLESIMRKNIPGSKSGDISNGIRTASVELYRYWTKRVSESANMGRLIIHEGQMR